MLARTEVMSDAAFRNQRLSEDFRATMRGLASTVSLISAQHLGTRFGMVATAVMSVSLEPAALAICINRQASIHRPISARRSFVVNVLSKKHETISRHFSTSHAEDRFSCGVWQSSRVADPALIDIPYLDDAQSVLFCKVREQLHYGTHTLFVAEVVDLLNKDEPKPLIYCQGSYGSFQGE